ncbi:immunity repressor [Streptomyces phage Dubu]|uniref:Immunity repressor n=1 Tax=Streptomyces phage Dubu TaxID=2591226 RepID=A0A514DEU4_9CAUD|nr:immunity repressor [Streptomyces phage Dubu]QDH92127.1 immunity repressor [Streptomyces phage Dubu]
MAKQTKKQTAQDVIERVTTLRLAGDADGALALKEEALAAVKACAPKDRKALEEELENAYALEPQEAPSTEVALTSYHEVEGVDALVDEGVKAVKDAVDAGMKAADMARTIAETLLEARLKMPNKHGLADVTALSKFTKNIAHDTFVKAREDVDETEDVERWATHQSLAKAVRNRMSDVVVERLRSLDANPEAFPAETMEKAQAQFPDLSPTEAVYALYASVGIDLPRKGRTELAREDARRRAELVRKAAAGELPAGDDTEEAEADLEAVERLEKSFTRLAHRAEKLPEEERGKVKARINAVIATLAAEAAKL